MKKTREPGASSDPETQPDSRPIPPAEERLRPAPDPKLKAALDNIRRRALERREVDEPEAA